MFNPTININRTTTEIKRLVAEALTGGQTVRLGRWTMSPAGDGQCQLTRYAEESRNGPLVGPVDRGTACPETQAADSLVTAWLGDW